MSTYAYPVTADDLDLEPPVKKRLLRVTTTATYLVWVEDYDDVGAAKLAERENRDACDLSDLIRNESAVDGSIVAEPLDEWDRFTMREDQHGPWRLCPFAGCEIVQYPAYVDPTCWKHRVTGCQHRNLPERTFE